MSLLTTKQVAEYLNCSETFVLDRARAGDIVGHRLKGDGKRATWRFSQEAIDNYLTSCIHSPSTINTEVAKQHNRKRRQAIPSTAMQEAAKRGVAIKF